MAIPFFYNVRNTRVRWRVTALSVIGIALVVAVVETLLSMSEGFASALRSTGRPDNAIIVERGTASEMTSFVSVEQRNRILDDLRVARDAESRALASWETLMVMSLRKATDGRRTSVTLRAVPPQAFAVRGGIRVTAGRRFDAGLDEVIAGQRISKRIRGLSLGSTFRYQGRELRVVGIFESDGGAFESEVWGDFATLGRRRRDASSSSLVVRMKDPADIPALDRWLRSQPGMRLQALPEPRYYENQAGHVATGLRALAGLVAVVMGVGAVFGAMNTMYAVVAARTREIGTLRALGFSRLAVLVSFVGESGLLALLGGVLGGLLALTVNGHTTSVANLQSFSEVAYAFRITPRILASGMAFAVGLGVLGGLLPALRAARLPIASAVREV